MERSITMDRLTTDNPNDNLSTLLNFAYAKDHRVVLSFADDKNDHDLCEYVANFALRNGCIFTPEEVMDGACSECDCHIAVMNNTAIQAAELRARLMMIEDILGDTYDLDHLRDLMAAEKEGRLMVMPCKVGDTIYAIPSKVNRELNVINRHPENNRVYTQTVQNISFFTDGVYLLKCCDGLQMHHSQFFRETWFLSQEEAESALAKDKMSLTKLRPTQMSAPKRRNEP
jgi:hypothetical protein